MGRQKRLALMCWRVANGFSAVERASSPDTTPCPPIDSQFERRMVTPQMKVQYQKRGGGIGYKKGKMGLETWWHGYGVEVRARCCTPARPCCIRHGVDQKRANVPPKCERCA